MNDVIISGYARTPLGSFQGAFSKITAPILGGEAIKKAIAKLLDACEEIKPKGPPHSSTIRTASKK